MRSSEEKNALVEEYLKSGLSQKAFCAKTGLSPSTFAYWVRKKKEIDNSSPGFIKIETSTGGVNEVVEIIYPNGVRLKTGKANLPLINQLIRVY